MLVPIAVIVLILLIALVGFAVHLKRRATSGDEGDQRTPADPPPGSPRDRARGGDHRA